MRACVRACEKETGLAFLDFIDLFYVEKIIENTVQDDLTL